MKISYLAQPLPLAEHHYVIIDRVRVPELPEGLSPVELVSPMLAPQARLYPWLVPLHQLPSGEWDAFMDEVSQHAYSGSLSDSCLFLFSPHPAQVVRNALVTALYFKDAHQNGHILRYYDPRVLFHLHWMLSPWQLFNQLPAREISNWTFRLEDEWHTLAFPERVSYQPGERTEIPMAQLQRIGMINRVLQALSFNGDMRQREEVSRKIDILLEQAVKCGLSTKEDCIAFAFHGLKRREGFWMAPKMAAFLTQARQEPDCYRDETSGWDENRWLEMTRALPHNTEWNH